MSGGKSTRWTGEGISVQELLYPNSVRIGHLFESSPVRLTFFLSLAWSALIFLPALATKVLFIPEVKQFPHSGLGILERPNWSLTYPLALPIIFGVAAYLSRSMRVAVERLVWPENKIILTATGAVPTDYERNLASRISTSGRHLFTLALALTVLISIADTSDIWRGGLDYLRGLPHKYPEWDWSVAYSLVPINPSTWKPPSFGINMLFDLCAYTAQASVIFLGLFWVGSYWFFLKNVSDMMIPENAPYRLNPMWNDPDSRLGLAPLGRVYNAFLFQTLIFQMYVCGHRLQQMKWRGDSVDPFRSLLDDSLLAWHSADFSSIVFVNQWNTLDTGTLLLLCVIGIPTIVISYLPLFRLRGYIQERRDDEWLKSARRLEDAVAAENWKEVERLERKNMALKNACVWPNGELSGWFFFLTTCCLALTAVAPSFFPIWLFIFLSFGIYRTTRSKKGVHPIMDKYHPTTQPIQVTITGGNIANLNFGEQVGTINASLSVLAGGGEGSQQFAAAIKQLTEAIAGAPALQPEQKKDAVDVVSTIAKEAKNAPAERSPGTLRSLLNGFPTLIASAKDVSDLWTTLAPTIKGYLGI